MGRSRDADGTASNPTRNDDLGARCVRRERSYAYVRAPCVDANCRARVDRDAHFGASHRYPNRSTYVDARPGIGAHVNRTGYSDVWAYGYGACGAPHACHRHACNADCHSNA
ncbi:MAG: hypothetical protein O2826_04490 [Chloroflexi bacterium]|nr:hypothetical protein [Chloroflexota bacterium]